MSHIYLIAAVLKDFYRHVCMMWMTSSNQFGIRNEPVTVQLIGTSVFAA